MIEISIAIFALSGYNKKDESVLCVAMPPKNNTKQKGSFL